MTEAKEYGIYMANIEQLKQFVKEMATEHKSAVYRKNGRSRIRIPLLEEDNEVLIQAYKSTNEEVKSKGNIIPAAEWLLDNYYIIEEQFKGIQYTVRKEFYKRLPLLVEGKYRDYPRIYGIAAQMVEILDGSIDEETLMAFLKHYQSYIHLTSKELWVFPIMLRICLLEKIKDVALLITDTIKLRKQADLWAVKLVESLASTRELSNSNDVFLRAIQEHESQVGEVKPAYAERLLHRLREEGADAAPIIRWLDGKLALYHSSADEIVHDEHQKQASYQKSIGNAITSLRLVTGLKWEEIFEELSLLNQVLNQDPAGIYPLMDFSSRDYYRKKVEELAEKNKTEEIEVAVKAIECARENKEDSMEKFYHVGYYIVDDGLGLLVDKLGGRKVKFRAVSVSYFLFFGSIGGLTLGFWLMFLAGIRTTSEVLSLGGMILSAFISFLPIWSIAIGIVHWALTRTYRPHHIPKLELKEGIPGKYRTIVAIPTLLTDEKRVIELVEQMEVLYLANQEENIHFALVGDYKDGPEEDTDKDSIIVDTGTRLIKELNQRYGREDIFFFFHRYRQWNDKQGSWMGWERKRGALTEFNSLLVGDKNTSYSTQVGDLSVLGKVKYVITLDADTQLPRDNAKRLIGAMAHPLNTPVLNEEGTRVVEGYGLMQPRIGISVDSASRSFFSLAFSGQTGVDPYTTAVSDVYQDLFHEGIFTGKGIYQPEIFDKVLKDAIPENSVLSHDLLEGSYVRTGLASDIELIDGYPAHYIGYSLRLHRWVRGDWQLLPWLFSKVRNRYGHKVTNPINKVSKWKILDNMRRSLLSPALYLTIVLSFTVLPGSAALWLGLSILTLLLPLVTDLMGRLVTVSGGGRDKGVRFSSISEETRSMLIQIVLNFVFLAHQAYLMTDAIVRSIWRVTVSHKNMLEWVTAADSDRKFKGKHGDYWHKMKESVLVSILLCVITFMISPRVAYLSFITTIAWIISPYIAWQIGKPKDKRIPMLSDEQIQRIRKTAVRTWKYFDDLVNEGENWLPPDNYQEDPPVGVAHRTSPTNIGLHLMSVLSARDLGYISTFGAVERIENTIKTLKKMDKWKGHFYNWYDTVSLEPLKPLYISTVDNGNLVGYLITLQEGLDELVKQPLIGKENILGLQDILTMYENDQDEQNHSLLNMMIHSEEVSRSEWQMLLDDLKGYDNKLDILINEYEKEASMITPWIKLLQKIPVPLLNEKGAYKVASQKLSDLLQKLNSSLSIQYLYDNYLDILKGLSETLSSLIRDARGSTGFAEAKSWLKELELSLGESYSTIKTFYIRKEKLGEEIESLIKDMDFRLLYDEKKDLFAIGYDVEDDELSKVYYDLLASEARQASFIAIAKGDVPQKHWFKMGRGLSLVGDRRALISWSGTMFEYFMPLLIMKNYDNTLLNETYTAVVRGQKLYAEQHRLPWGVSESGFYAFDLYLNYQYKAFGIPRLGLKRGLVNDRVVAPYASLLALTVEPALVYKNLEALKVEGLVGPYGFYEAIDYTSERMPKKQKSMIVKSFMAHHQGMILVAINNYLNNNIMHNRFHSVPMVKATELLLQERIPRREIYIKEFEEIDNQELDEGRLHQEIKTRRTFGLPGSSPIPETCLLSNGNYTVMLNDSGGGFSKWMSHAVTRWREDPTRGNWGMLFYIANLNSNNFWSATYLPVGGEPEDYKVVFEPDHAVYSRRDGNIETKTEVVVSPEFNCEVRTISLTNHSNSGRMIEITSYFEVVLCPFTADLAHPAFTNLFIRTEHVPELNTILANRRPRKSDEKPIWLFHTLTTDGEVIGSLQFETDRSKFIGRGRNLQNPQVMDPEFPLTNTTGAVLDPIVSLRVRVFIPSGETVRVSYMTGVADSREAVVSLARDCQGNNMPNRALELAWTHSQVELRYLNITAGQANLFQAMASQIIYNKPLDGWKQELLLNNRKGQSALWSYGISGDLPIVVLQLDKLEHMEIAKQMLTAHEYFRLQGLHVDLVLLNSYGNSYEQPVQDRLQEMISISHARDLIDMPGGVFIRQSSNITPEDLNLMYSVARIVLNAEEGSIANQMGLKEDGYNAPLLETEKIAYTVASNYEIQAPSNLIYQNELGGFTDDGTEYIIFLKKNEFTPLPWSNIIANEKFGFLVTESGSGYTWHKNSQANKLTPWSNDPIQDTTGEAIYIRDDLSGEYWTATPLPIRNDSSYLIRHGHGYSIFQNLQYGIEIQQTMFVPVGDSVKLIKLSLKNHSQTQRKLSLFFYVEWVLGVNRENNARFIITEYDKPNNGMLVYNRYNDGFSEMAAFVTSSLPIESYTSKRYEFLGINGSLDAPAAMIAKHLSNRADVNHDPCSAIQVKVDLSPGESKDLLFTLGQGENLEQAKKLMHDYQSLTKAENALQEAKQFWNDKLGVLQVETPDASMNLMLNKWLIYQTYACRVLARTGFYQAGGAYGFRDQLQDVMALVYSEPKKTREQILTAAEHQFVEGDVQHWWHPPHRGVRTRITDDLLFLPFVTTDYIERTGDWSVLDEIVSYLEDEPLQPNEHDRFSIPRVSEEKGSIYDHCVRAIGKTMNFGERGLPLMGGGDWNDGMDKVGIRGKGESVWLGWFLYTVLQRFIPVCRVMKDHERANRYTQVSMELVTSIEKHAWDGAWYRRAFFDDGTPLGSEINEECRIDSISQSWAVISGGAREERAKTALQAVQNHLVNEEAGLIKLLSPPFDTSSLEPGYIKGYVPGVRENGGQYTHAAVWTVMANARLGNGNQAWKLYQMINPINHTRTRLDINTYKGEPYVMAADVYAIPPHTGRGGWTWYTGSSGWMYRVGTGEILGFRKDGDTLHISPCIPEDWSGFSMVYRFGNTKYNIEVQNPDRIQKGVKQVIFDGRDLKEMVIPLKDDGDNHQVTVVMGVAK
jgi:cyclic beta-1,2-glucan synthetase